jgi:hypothetical protein
MCHFGLIVNDGNALLLIYTFFSPLYAGVRQLKGHYA